MPILIVKFVLIQDFLQVCMLHSVWYYTLLRDMIYWFLASHCLFMSECWCFCHRHLLKRLWDLKKLWTDYTRIRRSWIQYPCTLGKVLVWSKSCFSCCIYVYVVVYSGVCIWSPKFLLMSKLSLEQYASIVNVAPLLLDRDEGISSHVE